MELHGHSLIIATTFYFMLCISIRKIIIIINLYYTSEMEGILEASQRMFYCVAEKHMGMSARSPKKKDD